MATVLLLSGVCARVAPVCDALDVTDMINARIINRNIKHVYLAYFLVIAVLCLGVCAISSLVRPSGMSCVTYLYMILKTYIISLFARYLRVFDQSLVKSRIAHSAYHRAYIVLSLVPLTSLSISSST